MVKWISQRSSEPLFQVRVLAGGHKTSRPDARAFRRYCFSYLPGLERRSRYGYIGHDVVSYEISNKKGLLNAGNLPLPKKQDGKAICIVDIKITQSGIIILKSHFGFIFKYKLNSDGIVNKI